MDEYIIGESQSIVTVRSQAMEIAKHDFPVLITGETGTGKSLLAQAIHYKSDRRKIVSLNCACIPEHLFESELFGYAKGAFTGAFTHRKGLFVEADGGSIVLEEISNAPQSIQAKLLEVIETKKVRQLGRNIEYSVDFRLLLTTNDNLEYLVSKKAFREDLFYRINIFNLHIPPLRKRTYDIPVLADFFLQQYKNKITYNIAGFTKEAVEKMMCYAWPGNVRELQNTVLRTMFFCKKKYISAEDVILKNQQKDLNQYRYSFMFNKHAIESVMRKTRGNKSLAAKMLGVTRRTLYKYLKKHNLIK